MRYMIVEHFHNGDPVPVYRRFRDRGRQMPEGLHYVDSWIVADMSRCYQLMETEDHALLDEWMSHWDDITTFEVRPVISSAEAREKVAPRL